MVIEFELGIAIGVPMVDGAVPLFEIVTDNVPAVLLRKTQKAPAFEVVMLVISEIVLNALLVML